MATEFKLEGFRNLRLVHPLYPTFWDRDVVGVRLVKRLTHALCFLSDPLVLRVGGGLLVCQDGRSAQDVNFTAQESQDILQILDYL